jgi:hypothetical protein
MSGEPPPPDVDALVAELADRVSQRRSAGAYPPGLEEHVDFRFQHLRRPGPSADPPADLRGPLARMAAALPLRRDRIPVASAVRGGSAVHRAIGRVVARQTQGILEQVQAFAQPARESLEVLTEAVERLERLLRDEVIPSLDAVIERQAAEERRAAQAGEAPGGDTTA